MKRLQMFIINEKQTVKEAISIIQNNFSRCVVILNDQDKVVGVFSEGDVLRIILNDIDIHVPLKRVISPSFFYLKESNMQKAYDLIKRYGITLIPVIDHNFRLKDVVTIFDILGHMEFASNK